MAAPGPHMVPDAVRRAAAMVYVASLEDPVLADADHHHLARVLRLRAGETVVACDGAGGWRPCRWSPPAEGGGRRASGSTGAIAPAGIVGHVAPPAVRVAVGIVPTKGDRPEWAVQKLTEVGVDVVVVVSSDRSVVRWDQGRSAHHLERLRATSVQAGMQSRRLWLPEVTGVAAFADLVAGAACGAMTPGLGEAGAWRWHLAVPGGAPPRLDAMPTQPAAPGAVPDGIGVLIGPEGGWSLEEEGCGLPTMGLGQGVLRAETAAVAAGVLLVALRAGLVAPAPA